MSVSIYRLEIGKEVYTEKKDWLKVNDTLDVLDYISWDECEYEDLYFPTFKEMSEYIDSKTQGFYQYWCDVHTDDSETLEYHNGSEYDVKYTFNTSKVELPNNVIKFIVESYKNI